MFITSAPPTRPAAVAVAVGLPAATVPGQTQSLAWWIAGAAPDDVCRLPQRTGMQYTALGLVFATNFLILLFVWCKVGWHYFGVLGLLVPGITVPVLYVIGLDRLVAMRRRHLTGDLQGFSRTPRERSFEPLFRVASAVALSALSAFTFMMEQSADSTLAFQNKQARHANSALRAELEARVSGETDIRGQQLAERMQQFGQERDRLSGLLQQQQGLAAQAESGSRTALGEAAREAGGLGHRLAGSGPRHQAQMRLADLSGAAAAEAQQRQADLEARRASLDHEGASLRAEVLAAEASRNAGFSAIDARIRDDDRYVAPARGLFADATAFMRLFADPDEGLGRWLLAVLLFAVLMSLECAALIGLGINPHSPLDVLRANDDRVTAARLLTVAQVEQARVRSVAACWQPETTLPDAGSVWQGDAQAGTGR